MIVTYGSVCSGIEAASVAWEPLGMVPQWFSEIEPFPSAVLAHHWPNVPNLGDMNGLPNLIRAGLMPAPDVLVGGTPCQAFSVAGARKGLDDERGQLTITYVEVLNAIDEQRPDGDEAVCCWENVPGVLSSKDNAFGCFVGLLSGSDGPLYPEPQPERGKSSRWWRWDKKAGEHRVRWANAGLIIGPQRTIGWRILDAQYFGVAQRRRRVFLVASARAGFDPRAVLFESEGLRRDTPPSREAEAPAAAFTSNGVGTCGADDNQGQAGHLQSCWWDGGQLSQTLDAVLHKGQTMPEKNRFPAVLHGTQDPDVLTDMTHTLGRNHGQKNAVAVSGRYKVTNKWGRVKVVNADTALWAVSRAGWCVAEIDKVELLPSLAVRRLTPTECERLQGFPDGHTDIPYKNNAAPDGPRYKAIGNSKAVPVVRWVGRRLLQELRK